MKWLKVAGVTSAVLVTAVAGAAFFAAPAIKTGTGYAALNACGVELLAQRGAGSSQVDLPENPLVPHLRTSITAGESASSTLWGGLYRQTAYYVPQSGCTLSDTPPELKALKELKAPNPNQEWPVGNESRPKDSHLDVGQREQLEEAVSAAFGNTSAEKTALGTRAVIVVHKGKIVAERYADGFTADTRQLGWSMSKSAANLITGLAVRQGKLQLSDSSLFPEWTDDRKTITVKDLLTMTDGLSWQEVYDIGTPATEMLYVSHGPSDYAVARPLEHKPGTKQQYSSAATNLLCRALHDKTGLGHEMAQKMLFEPLHMASATFGSDSTGRLVCSSHMWATPKDWARMGLFALNKGTWDGEKLLPDRWIEQSLVQPGVPTDDAPLGGSWRSNELPDGSKHRQALPDDTFWATGHDGQRLMVVPSADLVVVRLGMSSFDVNPSVDNLTTASVQATTKK